MREPSPLWESNPRHQPYHGCALPTELRGPAAQRTACEASCHPSGPPIRGLQCPPPTGGQLPPPPPPPDRLRERLRTARSPGRSASRRSDRRRPRIDRAGREASTMRRSSAVSPVEVATRNPRTRPPACPPQLGDRSIPVRSRAHVGGVAGSGGGPSGYTARPRGRGDQEWTRARSPRGSRCAGHAGARTPGLLRPVESAPRRASAPRDPSCPALRGVLNRGRSGATITTRPCWGTTARGRAGTAGLRAGRANGPGPATEEADHSSAPGYATSPRGPPLVELGRRGSPAARRREPPPPPRASAASAADPDPLQIPRGQCDAVGRDGVMDRDPVGSPWVAFHALAAALPESGTASLRRARRAIDRRVAS